MSANGDHEALPAKVKALRSDANLALEGGDDQGAYDLLGKAIDTLGMTYYTPTIADDTNLQFLLAQDMHKKGNVAPAARLLQQVLDERLRIGSLHS